MEFCFFYWLNYTNYNCFYFLFQENSSKSITKIPQVTTPVSTTGGLFGIDFGWVGDGSNENGMATEKLEKCVPEPNGLLFKFIVSLEYIACCSGDCLTVYWWVAAQVYMIVKLVRKIYCLCVYQFPAKILPLPAWPLSSETLDFFSMKCEPYYHFFT